MPLRNSSKTQNQFNLQGTGASQFVQLMRSFGYNKDIDIELATVTSAPPALKIRVDGMTIDLDHDDLVVAQTLTNHTRAVIGRNHAGHHTSGLDFLEFTDELAVNDRVIVANISGGQRYIILDRAVTYDGA